MNVLKKIVIPRTNVTVEYILSELEEMAREEFHRLKKVKEKKRGKAVKSNHAQDENDGLCPVCIEKKEEAGREEKKKDVVIPEEKKSTTTINQKEPVMNEILKESDTSEFSLRSEAKVRSLRDEEELDSSKLEYLKNHINKLIVLGKSFIQSGMEHIDVEEFLSICEGAKMKIEQLFEGHDDIFEQYKVNTERRLEDFKDHVRDVLTIGSEIKEHIALEPHVECFIRACEDLDKQLNPTRERTSKASGRSRLEELGNQIDDVVKITTKYKNQGILSPSVEAFLQSCHKIKSKIKQYSQEETKTDKLNHLKEHVNDLDMLTEEVKKGGLETTEIENFSKACKQFKNKLEGYNKSKRKDLALGNLLEQIDETIGLSIKAKDIGLVGDSIEDFVKSSEKLKKQINPEDDLKANVLRQFKTNISDIMTLIDKYKNEGLLTDSVEHFITSCEITKNKIERYEICPPELTKTQNLESSCSGHCMVCNEPFVIDVSLSNEVNVELCKSCHRKFQKNPIQKSVVPCESCHDASQEVKLPSDLSLCQTCSNINEEPLAVSETEDPSQTEPFQNEETYCSLCKKITNVNHTHSESSEPAPVDSTLGYYEKKIRKVTKVTRTQNTDGTIREEKETISIRKVRRDPTETSLDDDDDDDHDYNDTSSDSYGSNDEKQVALCTISHQNQRGFITSRRIKSEIGLKPSPIIIAGLRSCISVGSIFLDAEYLNSQLNMSIESNIQL